MNEILAFLRELKEHNDRDWFGANKPRYDRLKVIFEQYVEKLIAEIATFDADIKGLAAKDCVYRIYRDIRFSPNKVPYKTYFGAYMAPRGGRKSTGAGYYLHIEPDNCLLSGGLWCPDPSLLKKVRQDIYDNIEEFTGIIRQKSFMEDFPEIDATDKLKRVPNPFPADFAEADLLKYKHYAMTCHKPDHFFEEEQFIPHAAKILRKLYPFNRFLNYTVYERD